ncbi:WXG100 family type VII secretion target [Mycobacteroides sp. LB1]|uniref:WXG100 family type VII secretion target n=1 Tax=Mycobacteroides sp. LB1 TaxID=2750814 RepID=UPI0015E02CDE|nr:WXG100 family type VII secretion target [Mycobacteroides sp. LB1]
MTNPLNLQVDTDLLHQTGSRVRKAASDSEDEFTSQHQGIHNALSGWSSRSVSAMQSVLTSWESSTSRIVTNVDSHGGHLHSSAYGFESVDRDHTSQPSPSGDRPRTV